MFTASGTLEVIQKDAGSQTITFDHCILASGSRPARIPAFDIGSSRVMDSTGALSVGGYSRITTCSRRGLYWFGNGYCVRRTRVSSLGS